MEVYEILIQIALVLFAAKIFAVLAKKIHVPMVVGEIIAGLLIGPALLNWVGQSDAITFMAEIGVVLLMFSAGLETNLKELKKTGPLAALVAVAGVAVPLVGGTILYFCFYGFDGWGTEHFYKAMFIGTIMTATSVSITVAALQEMGVLKGKIGTLIMSAAIIDDVIGIIVLTFVISMRNPESNPWIVIAKTAAFFAIAVGGGFLAYKLFALLDNRYEHNRRVPIVAVVFCFALAYCAEKFFGIADITGAYVAGIVLCNLKDAEYIERKVDISSYMFFAPIFFVSIGLKTSFAGMNSQLIGFCIGFVIVALITKIIGCTLVAKLGKNSWKDSFKVGIGMMTRGEVALIVAQKGLSEGLITADYFTAVILLIIVSSIIVPIILKLLYRGEKEVSQVK